MLAQAVESYLAVRRACGVDKIGLQRGPGLPRPTPHSLRHTFAVKTLEACPDGRDRITKHSWRCRPILVTARFPAPTGIWKQRRI